MIRDIAALREHGQVSRRVEDLDVDVETWRAGIRRAARQECIRVRTFLIPPPSADPAAATDDHADGHGPEPDPVAAMLVCAVRTDLPPEPAATLIALDRAAAQGIGPVIDVAPPAPAALLSFTDARARRDRHPSLDPRRD